MTGNCLIALQEVRQWLRHYPGEGERKGLILTGPVGVGKTYMITAIAKALTEKDVSVRFVDFFQLISQIKSAYAESKSERDILGPLLAVEVLIIDELGKGRNTDFEATILDQLVMSRYNENKILVASTNLSIKPIPKSSEDDPSSFNYLGSLENRVGKRIYSRLIETTKFVEMDGEDFRKQAFKT
jgi:DNA replication protein DnaC